MPDQTLEFLIKTRAQVGGSHEAAKALESNVKAAEHLNEALKEAVPGVGAVEGALGKLGEAATVTAVGITAVAAGVGLAAESVKEFMSVETAFAKLDSALARSGQLTDEYRSKLAEMAGELQKTTGKDDDEWMSVLTKLTQFGANSGNIDKSVEAVKNLAGILDGDLQSASMMVSKALQGQFDLFGRYGLRISETGTQTQRFNQLCEELAKRGGGQLEAQLTTLSGKTTTLWNNIKDITKGIGGWIASTGIIQEALDGLNSLLGKIAGSVEKLPDKLKGLTNAQNTATTSTEAQAAASTRLKLELEGIDRAYESQQRRLKTMASARDQLLASQKALELAELEEKAKKTGMSPSQLARNRMDLDKKYLGLETENKNSDLENERQGLLYKQEVASKRIADMQVLVDKHRANQDYNEKIVEPRMKMRASSEKEIRTLEDKTRQYDDLTKGVDSSIMSPSEKARWDENQRDKTKIGNLYRQLAANPALEYRSMAGAEMSVSQLKKSIDDFSSDTRDKVDPRLFEINQQIKTNKAKQEIDNKTLEANWRKETPDEDLRSQAYAEADKYSSAQKANSANEYNRQRYRQYYSQGQTPPSPTDRNFFAHSDSVTQHPEWFGGIKKAQQAASEAKEGAQSFNELMDMLLGSLKDFKATADQAKAGVKAIQEQNGNGRDR